MIYGKDELMAARGTLRSDGFKVIEKMASERQSYLIGLFMDGTVKGDELKGALTEYRDWLGTLAGRVDAHLESFSVDKNNS